MNYIIEGGLDFYAEINKNDSEDGSSLCLISGESLGRNHIELPCNHKFNYVPLYQEVVTQKHKYNALSTERLLSSQIKCPYCRSVSDKLLPFIPLDNGVSRVKGVNHPSSMCMEHNTCSWVFKSGKNKDCPCKKAGFETDFGELCESHWKSALRKKKPEQEWTGEMEDMFKKYKVTELKDMLRAKGCKVGGRKKDLVFRMFSDKC